MTTASCCICYRWCRSTGPCRILHFDCACQLSGSAPAYRAVRIQRPSQHHRAPATMSWHLGTLLVVSVTEIGILRRSYCSCSRLRTVPHRRAEARPCPCLPLSLRACFYPSKGTYRAARTGCLSVLKKIDNSVSLLRYTDGAISSTRQCFTHEPQPDSLRVALLLAPRFTSHCHGCSST